MKIITDNSRTVLSTSIKYMTLISIINNSILSRRHLATPSGSLPNCASLKLRSTAVRTLPACSYAAVARPYKKKKEIRCTTRAIRGRGLLCSFTRTARSPGRGYETGVPGEAGRRFPSAFFCVRLCQHQRLFVDNRTLVCTHRRYAPV